MADRYDPKLSLRPVGERRGADPRRMQAMQDDPLAELAKIVSGRSSGSAASRGRAPANDAAPAQQTNGLDLETELLNDLQASFAAVRDTLTQTAGTPSAPPPPPAARRAEPDPPPPAPTAPEPEAEHDPFEDMLPAHLAERLAPAPPAPPKPPEPVRADARRAPIEADEPEAIPLPEPAPARGTSDTAGIGAYRQRSGEQPEARSQTPAPPARARSRWDKPETAKPPAPVSRFAPPRAAASPPKSVYGNEENDDLDPLAELAGLPDESEHDEFPLDGFGELQADDDEVEPAPFPEGDLASMMEPRRSRVPLVLASVIGVVLVGGIAVAMFRPASTEGTVPPVIVADGAPTRITPDQTAAADTEQSKLIYDRVNSGEQGAEATVLTPSEQPMAVPSDVAGADNPISRVIIPAGPGFDDPAADEGLSLDGQPSTMPAGSDAQIASNDGDAIESIGPRRVRTVIVKPDGTIVESEASEAGQGVPADATALQPVLEPAPDATGEAVIAPIEPPAPAPVTDDTAAIAGTSGSGELAITPVPEIGGNGEIAQQPTPPSAPQPAPQPAPAPAATAAVEPAAPVNLNQNSAPVTGGMLVQVSSQRSEEAARATFRDLQARYPNILGPYEVNIQRADIPDRGTFFRVRVGPFSASDAQRLCNDLKSAGGDCILAQR